MSKAVIQESYLNSQEEAIAIISVCSRLLIIFVMAIKPRDRHFLQGLCVRLLFSNDLGFARLLVHNAG